MGKSHLSQNKKNTPPAGGRRIPAILWVAVAGLLLLVGGLAVLLRQPAQATNVPQVAGGPKLAVDQEQINFGTVPLGKPVKATFKLTNVGDQPLQIEGAPQIEVKKGC